MLVKVLWKSSHTAIVLPTLELLTYMIDFDFTKQAFWNYDYKSPDFYHYVSLVNSWSALSSSTFSYRHICQSHLDLFALVFDKYPMNICALCHMIC